MERIAKPINLLTNAELYEILKVRVAVFVVEQECPYQEIDGIDPDAHHLMIKDSGSILAYSRVFRDDQGIMRIGRILTTERGRGLGRDIMEFSLEWIRENTDDKRIILEAQTYAIGFYQLFGFKVISEEFLEDGIPHVWMERWETETI